MNERALDDALDDEIDKQIGLLTSSPSEYMDVTADLYGMAIASQMAELYGMESHPIERFLLDLRDEIDGRAATYGDTCDRVMNLCQSMVLLLKTKEIAIATQRAIDKLTT